MIEKWTCSVVLVASLAAAVAEARCGWRVWTMTDTTRVLRSDPPGETLPVRLAAARNEWESFQILVRSDEAVAGVEVKAGDLAGPGGAVLRADEARLFRQHQMRLTVGTHRNTKFRPGWYPDALVPVRHPLTRRALGAARLRAMPFDLPAGQTHGFWVDLHVPAAAKPGRYRGIYRLTGKGRTPVTIPVELLVWDFGLPAAPAMRTAFGSPAARMRGYYAALAKAGKEKPPGDWKAVDDQCADLLSRHRINATPPGAMLRPLAGRDGAFRIPDEQVQALREFVDRYRVNAVQVPHPRSAVKDPDKERSKLRAWLAAWDRAAKDLQRPQVVFYTYLRDEPNDEEAYRYVQKWGRAIRQARSAVKVLVVEQTWTQNASWGDLYGAVDIWCPLFSLFKPESAAARRKLGETIWTYTALCQARKTPWWHIDYPLLHYRVPAWIAWRYRIRGLLYWGGLSYWRQVEDPWTDPKTYCPGSPGRKLVFNGEGALAYPGRAAGFDGIAPSLRLKALRDGLEDYDYLALIERLGAADRADKLIAPLVESWFQWQQDPAAYGKARAKLAEIILSAKKG